MGTALRITEFHKKFGRRIQQLRKERNLSQEGLAEAIGVDRSYMGFVERGEKNPTLDKIEKLAKALKTSPKELFDF
jgi:transcriptional regulator with XRE-family HTH domain